MIEFQITEKDRQIARYEAAKLGTLKKSITNGKGNTAAFLGELIVCRYLKIPFGRQTFEYDFVFEHQRLDVKTKRCTSTPRGHYAASVAAVTQRQHCDFYIFTRVLETYDTGWILGWMSPEEFFARAIFCTKDNVDPNGDGHWGFKANCYNLEINNLHDIDVLVRTLRL